MKLYLAPESSFELMRYLRSVNGEAGLEGKKVRKKALDDAINTQRALSELDVVAQGWLDHAGSPVHAFVPDRAKGTSIKQLVTHVLAEPVPRGLFLDIGHDVCICTPQFAFQRLAARADLVDAVGIGMELCGSYSRWRLEPHVMGDPYYREHSETQSCTFNLPPATSAKRLNLFVERSAGEPGAVGARAALRWVADGSASLMETAVYLMLCLPKRLGGYGLPKPVLNPELTIKNPDGAKKRYPDLYWSRGSIDVEYNSDSAHSGEWARYRDSKREIELTVADVRVLPLTRAQLMNAEEFDAFAHGLRHMLGIRRRGYDLGWEFRRDELRRKLLAGWQQRRGRA